MSAGFIGGALFSVIGMGAFAYAKKASNFRMMIVSTLLMAYPYFVQGGTQVFLVGLALTAGLFFCRE